MRKEEKRCRKDNGEAFIKRNAKMKWKKTPNSRIEMPDYVERSYHEALINALAHRDYLVNGSEVHIDIYDDRMEIYSPGGMPDGSLIQERDPLTVPSTRRNPVLADVFNRLGYMERKGSGFGRIISSYEFQANYSEDKKPKFRSDRYQFTVVLPNLNYGVDELNVEFINDTKEISGANDAKVGANDANMENQMDILMKKMIENPQITQNELASELGVSRRTVQRIIEKLVSDAKIIRVGSRRSGYWQVVK